MSYMKARATPEGWAAIFEDIFAPFQRGSVTSRQAAVEVQPAVSEMQQRVLEFIQSKGADGATDEEVYVALGMNPSTERPRRVELCRKRLVVPSIRMRRTATGRKARVWLAAREVGF
jgi:hypothetical protein